MRRVRNAYDTQKEKGAPAASGSFTTAQKHKRRCRTLFISPFFPSPSSFSSTPATGANAWLTRGGCSSTPAAPPASSLAWPSHPFPAVNSLGAPPAISLLAMTAACRAPAHAPSTTLRLPKGATGLGTALLSTPLISLSMAASNSAGGTVPATGYASFVMSMPRPPDTSMVHPGPAPTAPLCSKNIEKEPPSAMETTMGEPPLPPPAALLLLAVPRSAAVNGTCVGVHTFAAFTSTGAFCGDESTMEDRPRRPMLASPHTNASPASVVAALVTRPANTWLTGTGLPPVVAVGGRLIRVGTSASCAVSPSPSWPTVPVPQPISTPPCAEAEPPAGDAPASATTASVWLPPHAMLRTMRLARELSGVGRKATVKSTGCASCENSLEPHTTTWPSAVSAAACSGPLESVVGVTLQQ